MGVNCTEVVFVGVNWISKCVGCESVLLGVGESVVRVLLE
jgi:hypothetical protein